MKEFFSWLYQFGGLIRFYSNDLHKHLRGYDITCTEYSGTPWYLEIGLSMLGVTVLTYILQYHVVNSPRYNKKTHWWLWALSMALLNFLIAYGAVSNTKRTLNYCSQLTITYSDCFGFALSNAIWSLIIYAALTSTPFLRQFSTNGRHTTFWKP